ncbi:MAG: bifunctional diaminohydroxyphosphoribosylaminopyrimidine deaminase/5-amino-6-(5-phosphoribosylamino)uracil reductase RibD, partial [Flavobacteriales bacterium]
VIGCRDPFAAVNGKGIEQLRLAGVEVITDVLHEQCRHLNRRFFTFHEKKRPYVILKWAQSADGFMDIDRTSGQVGSFMISSVDTQALVHSWRAQEAAILVGKNTFLNDNPSLTVRKATGRNPLRVVLSSAYIDLSGSRLNTPEAPTLVVTNATDRMDGLVRYVACGNVHEPANVLQCLHKENVLSILIEGGAQVITSFLKSGLWDEARIITSEEWLGSGLKAPVLAGPMPIEQLSGTDVIRTFFNKD